MCVRVCACVCMRVCVRACVCVCVCVFMIPVLYTQLDTRFRKAEESLLKAGMYYSL